MKIYLSTVTSFVTRLFPFSCTISELPNLAIHLSKKFIISFPLFLSN